MDMGKTKAQRALAAAKKSTKKPKNSVLAKALKAGESKSKYHNVHIETPDGIFDSWAERKRWEELKLLEKAGKVFALKRQVRVPLNAYGEQVGYYVADFIYCPRPVAIVFSPKWGFVRDAIVEDVKGHRTELYKWKKTHFKVEYGFAITEVKA